MLSDFFFARIFNSPHYYSLFYECTATLKVKPLGVCFYRVRSQKRGTVGGASPFSILPSLSSSLTLCSELDRGTSMLFVCVFSCRSEFSGIHYPLFSLLSGPPGVLLFLVLSLLLPKDELGYRSWSWLRVHFQSPIPGPCPNDCLPWDAQGMDFFLFVNFFFSPFLCCSHPIPVNPVSTTLTSSPLPCRRPMSPSPPPAPFLPFSLDGPSADPPFFFSIVTPYLILQLPTRY